MFRRWNDRRGHNGDKAFKDLEGHLSGNLRGDHRKLRKDHDELYDEYWLRRNDLGDPGHLRGNLRHDHDQLSREYWLRRNDQGDEGHLRGNLRHDHDQLSREYWLRRNDHGDHGHLRGNLRRDVDNLSNAVGPLPGQLADLCAALAALRAEHDQLRRV
jgi:hypothetical protein